MAHTAKRNIFRDAEAGSPYAGLGLAYMYHRGKNMDPDPQLAMEWYVRSAEAGCSVAKWELAKIYRDGSIAEKDGRMFASYLKAAADAGVPEAKVELGLALIRGAHMERDEASALRWMRSAAVQGDPMALFMTGYMYGRGMGTPRDVSEQEQWYARAGLKGNGDLFYWIGRNFEYGLFNVETDPSEAGRWYKMGADMGHEKCLICWRRVLSTLDGGRSDSIEERDGILMGSDVEREKLAREHALNAADYCFETGDEEGAFENYTISAELGDPLAMFTLAMMYHAGVHVKRSDRKAMELMMKASVAGSEDAQFTIGTFYEEGIGLKRNVEEAVRYYTKAAANGYLAAYYRLSLYVERPEIHVRNSVTGGR
ncbi:MAG: sel1 repeat family protein [Methanomassiliicoccaceae archaeon]|nr:sel1 repeat family protein [Methanomassiliicoccaceae archaeon]